MMESLERRELLDGVPLAAPTGLNISNTFSTSLILAWTDQSQFESGSRIQRSVDSLEWSTVGTVGADVTTFQDTGLAPNTTYYYRVVAFDLTSELASDPMTAATSSPLLQVGYDANGLSNLSYNGTTLLDLAANPADGFGLQDYKIIKWNSVVVTGLGNVGYTSTWDIDTHTLTYTYGWGQISVQYVQDVDRLNMIYTVHNTSSLNTIAGVNIFAMSMRFPVLPEGYTLTEPQVGTNKDGPSVIPADWQTGMLAVANDDVVKQLYVGYLTSVLTPTANQFVLWVGSTSFWSLPANWPMFDRPIAPLATDQYTVSLRFGPTGATARQLAPDVYAASDAQFPFQVNWSDHRGIGSVHLANSRIAGTSMRNPRGYFGGRFDVRTKIGLETFRKYLLHSADTSITVLQNTNAQGMIVWDLEGEQYPVINYVGEPRMLKDLAPEMEYRGAVDAYFKKFRDAGLRVGTLIRAQHLKLTSKGWRQVESANPYASIAAKIAYAHTRWGATLFYVDSNAVLKTGRLYDPLIFKKLNDTFPDCLIIPEHQSTRYYASTAPYQDLLLGETSTPDSARMAYAGAFSVTSVSMGDIDANHDQLVTAVRRGDILLFRGWFNAPENAKVTAIYNEAFPPAPVA